MIYTDAFIDELIKCTKKITDPPRDIKSSRSGFIKRTFSLSSVNDLYNFTGFITQNIRFSENFSIGLGYKPREEKNSIVLMRVNGLHGGTEIIPHHAYSHIHKATAERINAGLKPEGHIEECKEYTTLEQAIQVYIKMINLAPTDRTKYFPPPNTQSDLFAELN